MPEDQADEDREGFIQESDDYPIVTLLTEEEVKGRYAQVNLHNDSPFKIRHFEGEKETVVAQEDELGRDYLARSICDVVTRTQPPLTVAVYGRWGEGKTNMLKHVQELLGNQTYAVRTVWFNLWEHQDDVNPMIAMLEAARVAANSKEGLWAALDQKALDTLNARISDVARAVAWTAADIALPGVVDTLQTYRVNKTRVLKERMSLQDDQTTLRRKFHEALDSLAGEGRVVFFIDDCDRCLPDHVVDLLEKIKLFMDNEKCVFVIGADRDAVAQAIREVKDYQDEQWAARYMEKMVQVSFELPPIDSGLKKRFVLSLLNEVTDSEPKMLDDDCKNDIAELFDTAFDETDATVRLMIRTVNGFAMDHLMGRGFEIATNEEKRQAGKPIGEKWWKPRIGAYRPLVMAVFTAIKTCYPWVYESLRSRHADRGKLLEAMFKVPEFPYAAIYRNPAEEKEAEERINEKQKYADDLLGFFKGKDAFLTYVRGFVSPKFGDSPILEGVILNAYFGLGTSVLADGSVGRVSDKVTEESLQAHAPLAGNTVSGRKGGSEAENNGKKIVHRQAGQNEVDAFRTELRDIKAFPTVTPLRTELAGYRWLVLEKTDSSALLLSDRILDYRPYHIRDMKVTWEVCDLRHYLNTYFFEELGPEVQQALRPSSVVNPPRLVEGIGSSMITQDRVFLLSWEEVSKYFSNVTLLLSTLILDLPGTEPGNHRIWWWLRSFGATADRAAVVRSNGRVDLDGRRVSEKGGVRPAFWLNLEPTEKETSSA